MFLASDPQITSMIAAGTPVAIGVSGGKDSQAAVLSVFEHLDRVGHAGSRILVHADLGTVEWRASLPVCQELADHLGSELVVLRRRRGDLMDRWESRWQSSVTRYQDLSTVTLVPCWSTPSMRFCTSEMKTHPIDAMLKRRFPAQPIINVTGVRRAESRRRARLTVADLSSDGRIWNWRPILDWSEDEVFACIARHGLEPHPAYRQFGMSRVSCRFCIMSSLPDLIAATRQGEAHPLFRHLVSLECRSGFAFQGARWLGEVAPQLLDRTEREQLADAKLRAAKRIEVESTITADMLYVRGWPTRVLSDREADTLASVRRVVTDLYGFRSSCLDRRSIQARYRELLSLRQSKIARSRP
ncbi:MAG: phosphoadenosine phosphosulfate reductase family protein [Rhizobiaceae bacterium]|nr:phosphoadenosine phosphosulfate reductase family protein [Rhizobiaceae bacterium]